MKVVFIAAAAADLEPTGDAIVCGEATAVTAMNDKGRRRNDS